MIIFCHETADRMRCFPRQPSRAAYRVESKPEPEDCIRDRKLKRHGLLCRIALPFLFPDCERQHLPSSSLIKRRNSFDLHYRTLYESINRET
ncbi:alpha/beta hydrolase [Pseudozyma hubeiensis SY62]|uniref:Alpha/beta hydrolase n=1 Tax=Pseudozyma hubeiensis (strain SY62) TaxID=1305764 RepID=R9P704_PSEHS|nr:alpha/beta hydrolase [Pseudozyma hubeiensis SY62]GAC97183.1 alpha/beta hydrolase [Pseudozyma hubeiensis SY62]